MTTIKVINQFDAPYNYLILPNLAAPGETRQHGSLPMTQTVTTKTGDIVPGFRQKIREVRSAGSAYSIVSSRIERPRSSNATIHYWLDRPYDFIWHHDKVRQQAGGYLLQPVFPVIDTALLDSLVNRAKVTFLNKARNELTMFNGLTFFGELREALHGIRHPAEALQKSIRSHLLTLKKGVRGRQSRSSRQRFLRSTWLETQFHWVPILSDAKRAAETLSENINHFKQAFRPVSVKDEFKVHIPQTPQGATYGYVNVGWLVFDDHLYKVKIVGCVAAEVQNPALFDSSLWGFRPRDFIPTAYELIPWSWAVDYFTNVGRVLSAWSFPMAQLRWCSITATADCRRIWHPSSVAITGGVPSYNQIGVTGLGDSMVCQKFTLSRTPDFGALPSFSFELSRLGNWKRIVNLASAISLHKSLTPFF